MSGLNVGSIIDHSRDPNPSTGPHLDVRINRLYGEKGPVDPGSKPGLLKRLRFGDDRRGLASYPVTSPYGMRTHPVHGTQKMHHGIDYGIDAGTQIYWDGEGRYSPENTIGVIYTNDEKGNPYEVLLTHTDLGSAGSFGSPSPTDPPATVDVSGPGPAPEQGEITPQQDAVERVQNYAAMSKAQLDAAYDDLRASDMDKAAEEGMKMHNAFFNKP